MNSLSVTLGALGLVESLAKLIKIYDTPSARHYLDDILGELMILQNVLAESVLMMEDFLSEPPASALVALNRCQELERSLEQLLARSGLDDNAKLKMTRGKMARGIRILTYEDKLRRACNAFKSAVLLFRDIATE